MNIAIDARSLGTGRAIDIYTRNIVDNLLSIDKENSYILVIDDLNKLKEINNKNYTIKQIPKKIVFRDHLLFKQFLSDLSIDLVFHPDNTEFLFCFPKSVVVIHDIIPIKFPRLVLSKNPLQFLKQKAYFYLQERALKKASKIISVSKNTKTDLIEILKIPSEKVEVVYEGIEERFKREPKEKVDKVKKKYKIEDEYIFYLGGFGAHKNVLNLIEAFNNLEKKFTGTLVLGGTTEDKSSPRVILPEIRQKIKNHKLSKRVIFTGFIAEGDLPALYSGTKVFVYPSLYEGFGRPPLEALACGSLVVVSNTASLPEVVGEAGIYIDPNNVYSIEQGLLKALQLSVMEKEDIQKKVVVQLKKFSWETSATETLEIFSSQ